MKAARKVTDKPLPPSSLSFIIQIRLKVPIISLYCSFLLAYFQFQFTCYVFPSSVETFDSNFSIYGAICLSYMPLCRLSFLKHELMTKLPWTSSWMMEKGCQTEAINPHTYCCTLQ